ncbi:flagellar protein FliS [Thalassospira sp. NFXS8]|uniref:flagellar protein FliS n=1 Tax=Thalassospira sp. NFXS8 TaxID=2819093 RepID=UPI0032DF49F4
MTKMKLRNKSRSRDAQHPPHPALSQFVGASSLYNNALRTTSPVTMMVLAITRVRQHLRQAAKHRAEGQFEEEIRERSLVLGKLRGLRAVVAPNDAPELSRDLMAFYTRMLRVLTRAGRDIPRETRYSYVDRHLEAMARQWNQIALGNTETASSLQSPEKSRFNQVL